MTSVDWTTGVRWKLHLASPPEQVYAMFATDRGRAKFWSESSLEKEGIMELYFMNGEQLACSILEKMPPNRFSFHYFAKTTVVVEFRQDEDGGTDLTLSETGFPNQEHRNLHESGWISVLMNLKAAVDFGMDLRNHNDQRTWDHGYCES